MKSQAYYARKLKPATHLLFYKHHKKPGVKGSELRKKLGSDYPKVLKILNTYLGKLGLQIKTVLDGEKPTTELPLEQLDKAKFYITINGRSASKEPKLIGWRIDDIAGLSISILSIIAKKGKIPRQELEDRLRNKLPSWRVDININRYINSGYLTEDENKNLYLDWRTKVEIDQKALIDRLMKTEG